MAGRADLALRPHRLKIDSDKRERHWRHKDKDCRKRFTVTTGMCSGYAAGTRVWRPRNRRAVPFTAHMTGLCDFTLSNVVWDLHESAPRGARPGRQDGRRRPRARGGKVKAKPVERTDGRTLIAVRRSTQTTGCIRRSSTSSPMRRSRTARASLQGRGAHRRIESVWAVLKRSSTGTWHHVSPKHLGRYVNASGQCEVDTIPHD